MFLSQNLFLRSHKPRKWTAGSDPSRKILAPSPLGVAPASESECHPTERRIQSDEEDNPTTNANRARNATKLEMLPDQKPEPKQPSQVRNETPRCEMACADSGFPGLGNTVVCPVKALRAGKGMHTEVKDCVALARRFLCFPLGERSSRERETTRRDNIAVFPHPQAAQQTGARDGPCWGFTPDQEACSAWERSWNGRPPPRRLVSA